MIFFDLLMTLYEDFIICYFLISFFLDNKKYKLICLLTLICTLETFILNNYFMNNELLLFTIISTCALALYIVKREINLYYVIIPSLLMGLLLISNIGAFYITSSLIGIQINDVSSDTFQFVLTVLLSRVIFLVATILLYKCLEFLKTKKDKYVFFEYKSYAIFIICLFSIITTIGESIVYGTFDYGMYLLLIVEFVLMAISAIVLFVKIQNNYKNQLKIQSEIMHLKYVRKLYNETSKLSYNLSQDKHDMYYSLKEIEGAILRNDNKNTLSLLDTAIKKINKINIPYTSTNPVFDYMITKKIKYLKLYHYDVIYSANISQIDVLNDTLLVSNLEKYIDLISVDTTDTSNPCFEINLYKKNDYIIVSLKINRIIQSLDSYLQFDNKSSHIIKENIAYNDNYTKLNILIK